MNEFYKNREKELVKVKPVTKKERMEYGYFHNPAFPVTRFSLICRTAIPNIKATTDERTRSADMFWFARADNNDQQNCCQWNSQSEGNYCSHGA